MPNADRIVEQTLAKEKAKITKSYQSGPLQRETFSNTKYDIKNHAYPSNLMSYEYGGNYVMFYINVAIDSKLFNDKTVETVADIPPRLRSNGLIAQNERIFEDPTSGKAKAGFVGLNATGQIISGAAAGGILSGKGKGAVLGAAANAAPAAIGVGAAATQAASITRAQKRLKTAIALHVPNQLNVRYGVQWSEEDTFAYQAAAAGAEAITKFLAQGGKASQLGNDAAAVIGAMGLKSDKQGAAASAAMGLAANPKKEQLFKGVDFRSFQFDYQFFPRNEEEAANVLRIVETFKYHMHPEFKDSNQFLYIYPSEFDISYYQNGKENPNLHKHTSCVLTEMSINYTPSGQFNTFANGMPTQINMVLNFKELSTIHKDLIKEGL